MYYSLYTTKNILEKMLDGQTFPEWYNVLSTSNIKNVFMSGDFTPTASTPMGYDNPLSALQSYMEVKPRSDFNDLLKNGHYIEFESKFQEENAKERACVICVLDDSFSNEKAKEIEKKSGIFCQLSSNKDDNRLFKNQFYVLEKDQTGCDWRNFLAEASLLPTRNVILCDRYLFKKVKDDNSKLFSLGEKNIENLVDILNELHNDINISILIDPKAIESAAHTPDYANKVLHGTMEKLRTFIKNNALHKQKKINADIIKLKKDGPCYDKTHDRVIIGEYFTIEVSHTFDAFRDGRSMETQTLHYSALFGFLNKNESEVIKHKKILLDDYRNVVENNGIECCHFDCADCCKTECSSGDTGYAISLPTDCLLLKMC